MAKQKERGSEVFEQAGIINLHPHFNPPPESIFRGIRSEMAEHPELWQTVYFDPEIPEIMSHSYDVAEGGRYLSPLNHLPLFKVPHVDGLVMALEGTAIFKRLWGVHQLGPHRDYPIKNNHTRAEHSIMVTTNAVSMLQSMYNLDPTTTIGVLERDFKEGGLPLVHDLLGKASRVLTLATMLHDAGTVAGGDTFKYYLKSQGQLSEEEMIIEQVLRGGGEFTGESFDAYRQSLQGTMAKFGLTGADLDFAIRCIQGKSPSLIGEILNPSQGDKLDADRIGYTLQDWLVLGALTPDLPKIKHPNFSDHVMQRMTAQTAINISVLLNQSHLAAILSVPKLFPWNTIDPTDEVGISTDGKPIFMNEHATVAVALFRTLGVINHYTGYKMLGLEKELQDAITDWTKKHGQTPTLSLPFLLSHTDKELYSALDSLPDNGEIAQVTRRLEGLANTTLFSGGYVSKDQIPADAFGAFPVKIKPGNDTLIVDKADGQVTTLGEYCNKYRTDVFRHPLATALSDQLNRYKDSYVVIRKGNDQQNRFISV